ncbi:PREDICTED: borealin-like [Calidris pugnax]|uniref:borealin-like n=1 Tax=Calidris pugnax TaxID=198806 RepID=UPI00071E4B47|nr:PREDICTED: borealin-like [Calidris pugnax]
MWIDFLKNIFFSAKGGSTKVLEEAAAAALGITKIDKLTAEVIQTPLKIIKKVEKSKQDIEEGEPPLLPLATENHDSQCLPDPEAENINPRTGKVKQKQLYYSSYWQNC